MRSKKTTEVKAADLRSFLNKLCGKAGISRADTARLVEALIETSLRGVDSHGIRLVPHYVRAVASGRVDPAAKPVFKRTGPSAGVLDARHGFGIPAGIAAMDKAVAMAKATGVGAVAVKNSSHFGAAAIFALHAARKNMMGFAFTHSDALVFPHGGARVFLGTNPVCFAAPCVGRHPFVLDMATSRISWNKLREHRTRNAKLGPNLAADRRGVMCTDPHAAVGLLPAADYKGYGLGLVVEILCSTLTGMPAGPKLSRMFPVDGRRRRLGHFFMAIDISRFTDVRKFRSRLSDLLKALRAVPAAPGAKKVQVAGDPEWDCHADRTRRGIPLSIEEIEDLREVAGSLNIDTEPFRWLSRRTKVR